MIYKFLSTELIVAMTGMVLLGLDAFRVRSRGTLSLVAGVGLIGALIANASNWGAQHTLLGGAYQLDDLSIFFKSLMLIITFTALMISADWLDRETRSPAEYYALFVFVCLGMLTMASASDLVTIFIALELTSMPLYVLAASSQYNQRSAEAGLKFFLLGALASAFYLLGAALTFGSLGTLYVAEFPARLAGMGGNAHAAFLGLLCMVAAFGFKVAAAPFHMWAPDVYQGAPVPVTAFLSTGPKVGGVAVLCRLLMGGFFVMRPEMSMKTDWVLVVSVLALLSMTVGNLVAMHQTSMKRMMAYSGISHMGYLMVGLAAASRDGLTAVLFYQFLYTLTALGAWAVIIQYSRLIGSDEIKDFAGLSRRAPGLALLLMLSFLSLAGLPPLAGFIGKFYLFRAAWESGLPWLAVVGIVNSVASLFYYMGVLKVVYFESPASEEPVPLPVGLQIGYSISLFAIVVLGMMPAMSDWAFKAATTFVKV